MSEVNNAGGKLNLEQEVRCLFCGKSFPVKDIVFAKNEPKGSSSSLVDQVFEKAMDEYKLIDGEAAVEAPLRRFLKWNEEDVNSTEAGPDGSLIPLTVVGHLTKDQIHETRRRSFLASLDDEEEKDSDEESKDLTVISSVRLCPHCHMTLPDDFSTQEVRRIGLLGGSRCGKTTYMVVACKYMEEYLGLLSGGLDLGDVRFLDECNTYLNKLYENQKNAAGAVATQMDNESGISKEKPVFPIIAQIKPTNSAYKPFYVIIQDIPGEYMLPENRDKLINSAIPQSTDLISLVDINSLTWTPMKDTHKYGDYCDLSPGDLFKNLSVLGNELNRFQRLETIQLCLTKLDFWMKADEKVGAGTVLSRNGNQEHRGSISDRRLSDLSIQLNHRLKNVGEKDQSGLMEVMIRNLNLTNENIHKAYIAVASRMVPGNEIVFDGKGIDYSISLNVLEPMLNIFSWANLLPHDDEERVLPMTEDDEQTDPEPPKLSFWKRLFHRE